MHASPTLVLLPGMDGTATLFGALRPLLDRPAQAIAYPTDVGDRATLLEHAAAQLPPGPLVIVAESYSGPIGVALARRDPRVVGLVLCASFLRAPHRLLGFVQHLPLWSFACGTRLRALLRLACVGFDAPAATVDALAAALRNVPVDVLRSRLRQLSGLDVRDEFAALRCPVLHLTATHDWLVHRPSAAERVARGQPNVAVDGPHFLLQTRAAACWRAIAPWLDALAAQTAGHAPRRP